MPGEPKVTRIERRVLPKWLNRIRVAVYCRVSTAHAAQEESLEAQIDKFKKMVAARGDWLLVDVYSDIASGKNTTGRPAFNRLMQDCAEGKIDMILSNAVITKGQFATHK